MIVVENVPHTILSFFITEVLGHGQTRESHTSAGPGGFVHLTKDQRHFGLAIEFDDTSLLHFVVKIVALTRSLADTRENRETTVCFGNVVLSSNQYQWAVPYRLAFVQSTPE